MSLSLCVTVEEPCYYAVPTVHSLTLLSPRWPGAQHQSRHSLRAAHSPA